jgi:hypothetical protein
VRGKPGKRRDPGDPLTYAYEFAVMKQEVKDRSGGRCEARTPRCTGRSEHVHHRRMRSQGGSNTLDNLLDVCLQCHLYIHSNPTESYERFWLIRMGG